MNIVLIGAGGGIGRALLANLAGEPATERVIATYRESLPTVAPDNVTPELLDLAQPDSIGSFMVRVQARLEVIDLLIVASGILHGPNLQPEKSLRALSSEQMQLAFQVNAAGPLEVLSGLESQLKAAAQPRICFLSAQVGSIEDNGLGGWYSYRASKAALNMGVKTAAIELARWRNTPVAIALHPGTTATSLSQPFIGRRADTVQNAERCADKICRLLGNLQPQDNGSFLRTDGTAIPW